MPVYVVRITAPNGNQFSRPIVAACACDAVAQYQAEHDIADTDPRFTTEVLLRPDPDGDYEAALLAGARRREEADRWSRRW